MRRSILCTAVTLAAVLIVPRTTAAQSHEKRPIDRWLVTTAEANIASGRPLSEDGGRVFPDRDRTVGPGYWTLMREDGRERFDLADVAQEAGSMLAHAYIKAPRDATFGLGIGAGGCGAPVAWLNGQLLPVTDEVMTVRLARGWNTLLVALPASSGCAPELAAFLSDNRAPSAEHESALPVSRVHIQASRPHGVRSNLPAGIVQIGMIEPSRVIWRAGSDDLITQVTYTLTSWGARDAFDVTTEAEDLPTAPPTVDLTGEWTVTFYTPSGIQVLHGDLTMSDDGELTGRLSARRTEDERLKGNIHDGWVSGDEFGWTMRFSTRGGSFDIGIRGVLTDGEMSGTLDFGGFRGFESRFKGTRTEPGGEAADDPEIEPAESNEPTPSPTRQTPPPTATDRVDTQRDPADAEAQRARIIEQLLPPPRRVERAPTSGSVELQIAGRKLTGSAETLEPLDAVTLEGEIEFGRVRKAALDKSGVKAKVRWEHHDEKFVGRVSAAAVLDALHAPISLEGWTTSEANRRSGTFRIPDRLGGFTLRGVDGDWEVDGKGAQDGILCSPCRKGARLELSVDAGAIPQVMILEPGFPAAEGRADAPPPEAWLETLKGDNEGYRDLGRRFGGAS